MIHRTRFLALFFENLVDDSSIAVLLTATVLFIDRKGVIKVEFTSIVKSQSGDGVRRCDFSKVSAIDGEPLGSSGITANRPRCTHGDVAPYEPNQCQIN